MMKLKKLFTKAWKSETTEQIIKKYLLLLEGTPSNNFNKEILNTIGKQFIENNSLTVEQIYLPLRWLLTAATKGVGIPEIFEILGKDRSLSRIHSGLKWIHDKK